jgi:hypothetical protein
MISIPLVREFKPGIRRENSKRASAFVEPTQSPAKAGLEWVAH